MVVVVVVVVVVVGVVVGFVVNLFKTALIKSRTGFFSVFLEVFHRVKSVLLFINSRYSKIILHCQKSVDTFP